MAPRRTPKRSAGVVLARRLDRYNAWRFDSLINALLYEFLETRGYCWHPDKQKWLKQPYIKSVFVDDNGNSSGQISIRIRAHAGDLPELYTWLCAKLKGSRYTITETDPIQWDDNGVTGRIYIRATRKGDKDKSR